jgi:pimeloyl-ACP methyl ester carboxylesterase
MTDLTLSNGALKLTASVYGRPDGPPLLFLHGLGLSRDSWAEGAQRLMDRYQIWTLDFRGHGHSDHVGTSYDLEGYRSDAVAALAAIARPTLIVGHSLGGVVAGLLAQTGDPNVRAVYLEDPPWYMGEPSEWQRTAVAQLFVGIRARQASWRRDSAPLAAILDVLSNAPSPNGGLAEDHILPRHLLSQASALQRQDSRCWALASPEVDHLMVPVPRERPLPCPAMVIQADTRFGAVFLSGHETRFTRTSPHAEIVRYEGAGHNPHRSIAFENRFYDDLEAFASRTFVG